MLERLAAYRSHDAPTHGGSVLSYVYDSGLAELDALAASAAAMALPVNGLDPTTFPSVALMEADLAWVEGPTAVVADPEVAAGVRARWRTVLDKLAPTVLEPDELSVLEHARRRLGR